MPNCPTCKDEKGNPLPLVKHGKWWVCKGEIIILQKHTLYSDKVHKKCKYKVRRGGVIGH